MKPILITGACGFIGFHVAKTCLDCGYSVKGLDNLNDYYDQILKKRRLEILKKYKNFNFYHKNLASLDGIKDEISIAINFAAQAGVRLPKIQHYKYEESNIKGFKFFLDFCDKMKINHVIYASSSSVYSGLSSIPYREEINLKQPTSKYAQTKISNEFMAREFAKKNDRKVIGLRFFTVYGPWGRPDMAYYQFTKKIVNNEEITLFNNGQLSRDMTYIEDIVRGVMSSIDYVRSTTSNHEIFNLGNEKPIKTVDLLKLIQDKFNKNAYIKHIENSNEVKITCADITKAKIALGYQPTTEFHSGMSSFFNWFKSYYEI